MQRLLAIAACAFASSALAGQNVHQWWQRETQISPEGRLTLEQKSWWPRAVALKDGERFTVDLSGDGRPDMVVARVDGDIVEAIDDTNHAHEIWNKENTTYVVSYGGTGKVDRMVSYIGNGHGGAREVELRYFRDGYLRYAWFAESEDGDAASIFALKRWQYAGNDHGSQFRGNAQIYINKYDLQNHVWQPLSECPFSFWDLDHDGRTDVTLRVSAAPLGSLHDPDTDYANNYDYIWAEKVTPLPEVGAVNMRLSFNLDARPRTESLDKPHSTFSFTMVGQQPYLYSRMRDFNARRRYPQTTIHLPWSSRWSAASSYPATVIGLTWDEARHIFRWEGEFWAYERRYISNTGSPNERWNMRREYAGTRSSQRALYYSEADRRYHLVGAQEAWLEVGHLVNDKKDLEFRWWDSDGDGRLDTIEIFRGDDTEPSRIAHLDPHARAASLDPKALAIEYSKSVIPAAIAEDIAVIKMLKSRTSDELAAKYEDAANASESQERRRFCLDIARELLFLKLRDEIRKAEARLPYPSKGVDRKRFRDPAKGSAAEGYTLGDSLQFWELVRSMHELDQYYANADFGKFGKTLQKLRMN